MTYDDSFELLRRFVKMWWRTGGERFAPTEINLGYFLQEQGWLNESKASLNDKITSLCDAVQWIVNRGPDKVPSDLMERMKEWGT